MAHEMQIIRQRWLAEQPDFFMGKRNIRTFFRITFLVFIYNYFLFSGIRGHGILSLSGNGIAAAVPCWARICLRRNHETPKPEKNSSRRDEAGMLPAPTAFPADSQRSFTAFQ
jgi:hypothetical protein